MWATVKAVRFAYLPSVFCNVFLPISSARGTFRRYVFYVTPILATYLCLLHLLRIYVFFYVRPRAFYVTATHFTYQILRSVGQYGRGPFVCEELAYHLQDTWWHCCGMLCKRYGLAISLTYPTLHFLPISSARRTFHRYVFYVTPIRTVNVPLSAPPAKDLRVIRKYTHTL